MKKIICILLVITSIFAICSCDDPNNNPSNQVPQPNNKPSVSDEDLKNAFAKLLIAEEGISVMASTVLNNWSTHEHMLSYWNEEIADYYGNESKYNDFKRRIDTINGVFDEVKTTMGSTSTGDFYDALKAYYVSVNKYFELVSKAPSGYSKLTYMQAISDCKSECQSKQSELDFYI